MSINKVLYILLWLLIIQCTCLSQEYVYKHYTRDNGLPGKKIYCCSQDKDGFIWFGTENGASRFDGKNFVNFNKDAGLTDNEVLEIYSDKIGRTWFVCYTGSLCYYFKGKIYNYSNDTILAKNYIQSRKPIRSFFEDKFGTVWFMADKIWGYNNNPMVHTYIPQFNNFSSQIQMFTLFIQEKGILSFYISNRHIPNPQVTLITVNKNDIAEKKVTGTDKFMSNISKLKSISNNILVVNKPGNIIKVNNQCIQSFILINDHLNINHQSFLKVNFNKVTYSTSANNYWVSTTSGAIQMDLNFSITKKYLANENIIAVLEDRDGNLWFNTLENGFFFLSKSAIQYFNKDVGLYDNDVKSIAAVNNSIYCGFKNGIVQKINPQQVKKAITICINATDNSEVKKIIADKKYRMYYCTEKYILSATGKNKLIKQKNDYKLSFKDVSLINDSILFYGTHRGAFIKYPNGITDTFLINTRITAVSGLGNQPYLATADTIYYLNKKSKPIPFTAYNVQQYGRVSELMVDANNTLYVATYNNGLVYFKQGKIFTINEENGLISNSCRRILLEADSVIWLLTTKGISKISLNPELTEKAIVNYSVSDGFSSDYFSGLSKIKDTIFVATENGLNWFTEKQISSIPDHSPVITNFLINNKLTDLSKPVPAIEKNYNIKIRFSGISFSSADNLTFKYLLKGASNQWTTTKLTEIEFPDLPAGKYEFTVYAINKNMVQSKAPDSIKFEVLPAFWQTWWFILSIGSIIGLMIFLTIKYRIQKIKKDEKEKTAINRQFAELRLEAVRSQMNPHFVFNCLNSIQHFNFTEDYKSSQYFMAKFAHLIRSTLNHSKQDFVTLAEEIALLKLYIQLEQLRFEDLIDCDIIVDEKLIAQQETLLVPSLIFQPYVENAINHGIKYLKIKKGFLCLQFNLINNKVHAVIDDNGIGILASKKLKANEPSKHTSFGLALSNTQIEVINKIYEMNITCTVWDKSLLHPTQQGTKVEIVLPIKYKNQ